MDSNPIDPIIVVGAGRSGSTLFHDLLTHHPELCWLPARCDDRPRGLEHFRPLFRWVDTPVVGPRLRRRYGPTEGYGFWNHHFPGFATPCRDLRADDVTPEARDSIRAELAKLITPRRPRLLLKITGWPRAGFLHDVFPSARFIHFVRDGRSVAESLLRMPWWRGWGGPASWRWGPLRSDEEQLWARHNRSFVALAGIQWKKLMRAMETARVQVPTEQWSTIRYEDFCDDPAGALVAMQEFCGLSRSESFLRHVKGVAVKNQNRRWKESLEPEQQRILQDVLQDELDIYDYR